MSADFGLLWGIFFLPHVCRHFRDPSAHVAPIFFRRFIHLVHEMAATRSINSVNVFDLLMTTTTIKSADDI
jgi:hypothetical protein